jgi:hypothetical protein
MHALDVSLSEEESRRLAEQASISRLKILAQHGSISYLPPGVLCVLKKASGILYHGRGLSRIGNIKYYHITSAPGALCLTSGNETQAVVEVPCIETTSSYHTLGVCISPSGSSSLAYSVLCQQSQEFAAKIASSNLSREAAYWAYWQYSTPKSGLLFPRAVLDKRKM